MEFHMADKAIILMLNLKGGVAKTTNTVALAEALADSDENRSILVIDADHQCMASELLLGEDTVFEVDHDGKKTSYDLLSRLLRHDISNVDVRRYIFPNGSNINGGYPNLHVMPCSLRMDEFARTWQNAREDFESAEDFQKHRTSNIKKLRGKILDHYDIVLVDCPPSLNLQVQLMVLMADAYMIPAIPDRLSVRGAVRLIQRLHNRGMTRITGIGTLWSLVLGGNRMHRIVREATRKKTPPLDQLPRPFKGEIKNASAVAYSMNADSKPRSYVEKYTTPHARTFREVANELLQRVAREL